MEHTEKDLLREEELERVQGGAIGWTNANGNAVNHGTYIVYTVVEGDTLPGIAARFHVTVAEIQNRNRLKPGDVILPGLKLTIYPRVIR